MCHLCTHRFKVVYRVLTQDQYGSHIPSWKIRHGSLAGRLFPLSSRERIYHGREGDKVTHRLMCHPFSGLFETDVIKMGPAGCSPARTFQIKGFRDLQEQGEWLEIDLEEVR